MKGGMNGKERGRYGWREEKRKKRERKEKAGRKGRRSEKIAGVVCKDRWMEDEDRM